MSWAYGKSAMRRHSFLYHFKNKIGSNKTLKNKTYILIFVIYKKGYKRHKSDLSFIEIPTFTSWQIPIYYNQASGTVYKLPIPNLSNARCTIWTRERITVKVENVIQNRALKSSNVIRQPIFFYRAQNHDFPEFSDIDKDDGNQVAVY